MKPRALNEQQAADLLRWYLSPRTIAEKAKELGLSERTVRDYVKQTHKAKAA
jgi:predicted transcriptional regulator